VLESKNFLVILFCIRLYRCNLLTGMWVGVHLVFRKMTRTAGVDYAAGDVVDISFHDLDMYKKHFLLFLLRPHIFVLLPDILLLQQLLGNFLVCFVLLIDRVLLIGHLGMHLMLFDRLPIVWLHSFLHCQLTYRCGDLSILFGPHNVRFLRYLLF
jgi:hypothetical protein